MTTAGLTAEVSTLNYDASVLPLVTNARSADPLIPIWRVVYRAERPVDVLDYSEVNYVDALVDRGLYNKDETYRQGNMVWLADKSRWLYIWPSPAQGHMPGDPRDAAAPYWQQILNATDATTIYYPASGKSLAELEPAQKGADVTGQNTSKDTAAVAGRSAQNVIDGMDINTVSILGAILNGDALNQLVQQMALVSGQPVGNVFLQFKGEQQGKNDSMAYQIQLQASKNADVTASILSLKQTVTDGDMANAKSIEQVQAVGKANAASTKLLMDAFIDANGAVATAVLRTDADGVMGAFSVTADGIKRLSQINMVADEFYFVDRNGGGPPIRAMYYSKGAWQLADNLYVRNLFADTVTTKHLKADTVTGISTQSFTDVAIGPSEVNVAQMAFTVGDEIDGKAIVMVNFTQDSSAKEDTAAQIRAYVSINGGPETLMRNSRQGIVVGGGSARWVLPVSFMVPILGSGSITVRVTAQGITTLAGSYSSGSVARDILLVLFSGAR